MRHDLRWGRFWLVFGWVSVAVAMYLSLVPATELKLPDWNDKIEHCLGYFLLTLWFCGIYPRRSYWKVGLAMLAMGALVEVLQGAMNVGRQADVMDLLADLIGIVPALLLALTPFGQWPRWIERVLVRS